MKSTLVVPSSCGANRKRTFPFCCVITVDTTVPSKRVSSRKSVRGVPNPDSFASSVIVSRRLSSVSKLLIVFLLIYSRLKVVTSLFKGESYKNMQSISSNYYTIIYINRQYFYCLFFDHLVYWHCLKIEIYYICNMHKNIEFLMINVGATISLTARVNSE